MKGFQEARHRLSGCAMYSFFRLLHVPVLIVFTLLWDAAEYVHNAILVL